MTEYRASDLRVKLFCDGADLDEIGALAARPGIAGFTTNPTLMSKAGVTDYAAFGKAALALVGGRPISFEVLSDELDVVRAQAEVLHRWGDNVYVKVPITNSVGESMLPVVQALSLQGVRINVTAVMTAGQVRDACAALEGGAPAVVSVFAGRVADTGRDPVPLMQESLAICRASSPDIELLWASPRELFNVVQAHELGVDIITATPAILGKLALLGKDLLQFSLETVQMFARDGASAGLELR